MKKVFFILILAFASIANAVYSSIDGTTKSSFTVGGFPAPRLQLFEDKAGNIVEVRSVAGGGAFGPIAIRLKSADESAVPDTVSGQVSVLSGVVDTAILASGQAIVTTGNNLGAGPTGDTTITTGVTQTGTSGIVRIRSGSPQAAGGVSGEVRVLSGENDFGGNTGDVLFNSGPVVGGTGNSGIVRINSGDIDAAGSGNTGGVTIRSGDNAGSGNSGAVTVRSGTVAGGTRGKVILNAGGNVIEVQSNVKPDLDNDVSLGDAALRYSDIFLEHALINTVGTDKALEIERDGATRGSIRTGFTMPSSTAVNFALTSDNTGTSGLLGIATNNNATADANSTNSIFVETGNKTAGTGDSGAITLQTGTSSGGTRGVVNINASDLIVFSDIIPDSDNTRKIGRAGATYSEAFIDIVTAASPLTLRSIDENTVGSTGLVTLKSGDNAGAGNSGNVAISSGTAGGTRGDIVFSGNDADFTGMTSADFTGVSLTGVANSTLSNLASPTAINQNLLPDGDDTRFFGSSSAQWSILWGVTSNMGTRNIRQGVGAVQGRLKANSTTPAGTSVGVTLETIHPQAMGLFSASNGTADAAATGALLIESGNKTAGTGNSGAITLQTGTSAGGTRGVVNINASDLIVFSDIIPDSDNTRKIGRAGATYSEAFIDIVTAASPLTLRSIDENTVGTTGLVTLKSGDNAGAGNSGNVAISSGTAGGTRGDIVFSGETADFTGMTTVDFTGASVSGLPAGATTFADNAFAIQYNADATRQLKFDLSGIDPATTKTMAVSQTSFHFEDLDLLGGDSGTFSIRTDDDVQAAMVVRSGNESGIDTSGAVTVKSGDSAGGDSGEVTLETGTAGGTRGKIKLVDGSEGTSGHVWTSTDVNGAGAWQAIPATGANTALSNLAAVAINTSLLPATDDSIDLGSASKRWQTLFLKDAATPLSVADETGDQVLEISTNRNPPSGFIGGVSIAPEASTLTALAIFTTNAGGTNNSAEMRIETGVQFGTSGNTGNILVKTGNANTAGDTGNLTLETGTTPSGTRGKITANSNLLEVLSGVSVAKKTGDPCGDTVAFPEGTLFYNDTSDYFCFCNGVGDDVQMHAPGVACF